MASKAPKRTSSKRSSKRSSAAAKRTVHLSIDVDEDGGVHVQNEDDEEEDEIEGGHGGHFADGQFSALDEQIHETQHQIDQLQGCISNLRTSFA